MLSFVTQTISEAAEVNRDAAVGESEVRVPALVKSLFCDVARDLCGRTFCMESAKRRETRCCHLSVRGDLGRSWLTRRGRVTAL